MERKRFTITSALLYANGPIHLGHLAGAYLPADIFARYQKLKGHDVAFICGSDEHGAAITIQAKKDGIITTRFMFPTNVIERSNKVAVKLDFNINEIISSINIEIIIDANRNEINQFLANLNASLKCVETPSIESERVSSMVIPDVSSRWL